MKTYKKRIVMLVVSLALLMATSVVSAITIVIDGTEEAVWAAGTAAQTPGVVTDSDEGAIANDADVEHFRYTNDTTYFYILIDTFGSPTRWSVALSTRVDICLNTDNDTGTGVSYENCDGTTGVDMQGIDRIIRITPLGGTNLQWLVYDDFFNNVVGNGNTFTGDVATNNEITELRIPLSVLGLDTALTCNSQFPAGIYFDGGTVDPDDNVPDTGQATISCGDPGGPGGPTAVSLQTFGAGQNNTGMVVGLIGALLLGLLSTGYLLVRRQALPVKNR